MQVLHAGEYTGEIIHKLNVENSIITNTLYSTKSNNPAWHYHENLHICFVFQGGKAETKHRTQYTEKGGSIFFYHAEEKHRWIAYEPISKSANIEIPASFLHKYKLTELQVKEALQKSIDSKTLMLKIQKEILTNDTNSYAAIQSLLLELITEPVQLSPTDTPTWIRHVKELLHDSWNEEISLHDISQAVQVHPVTISKYFRKYFSCTLGEYRRKLKIEKSIDLIKSTKQSLSEIAYICNFSDQSHFTRNFKAHTGFLPKDFRNL